MVPEAVRFRFPVLIFLNNNNMKILFFAAMMLHQHNAEMQFKEMQDDGTIVYEGEDEDTGRAMFTLFMPDTTIQYVYEAEAINYIKTGTFQYNDFLK